MAKPLPHDDAGCGWYNSLPPPAPARPIAGDETAYWVVLGHRLAQRRHAHHGRVLVGALDHGLGRHAADVLGAVLVGKALAQVDRAMLDGEPRHDLEHGGAEARKNTVRRFHDRLSPRLQRRAWQMREARASTRDQ